MPNFSESLRQSRATRCSVCDGKLVSSGTIRGKPRFVPRSASITSGLAGKVITIG
jgi:hypothetical protein